MLKMIDLKWEGVEDGAEAYGYSSKSFRRFLHAGRVLGAEFQDGVWQSHPDGMVGPVGDDRYYWFILPKGTVGVAYITASGYVSGIVCIKTNIARATPEVGFKADDRHSGVQVQAQVFQESELGNDKPMSSERSNLPNLGVTDVEIPTVCSHCKADSIWLEWNPHTGGIHCHQCGHIMYPSNLNVALPDY